MGLTVCNDDTTTQLAAEANAFRNWAAEDAGQSQPGEWECDYPNWGRAYAAVESYLRTAELTQASAATLTDLLYLLACDNECEIIARSIATLQPLGSILHLAEQSRTLGEPDARWQLAVQFEATPRAVPEHARIEAVLLAFMDDEDEYVRRRSLGVLALQGTAATEQLALDAWGENHESQEWTRMNVLSVLSQVGSSHLPRLLHEAAADPRPHLAGLARDMLEGKPG